MLGADWPNEALEGTRNANAELQSAATYGHTTCEDAIHRELGRDAPV